MSEFPPIPELPELHFDTEALRDTVEGAHYIAWRIYYSDGTTFDSTQGEPVDSPVFGVQCIVMVDPEPSTSSYHTGRLNVHAGDWYWWDGERWWTGDLFGLLDAAIHGRCKAARQGQMLPVAQYNAIYKRAEADEDFPRRSAFRRREEEPTRSRAYYHNKD